MVRRSRLQWCAVTIGAVLATLLSIAVVDRPAARFAHDMFHGDRVFVALTHIVDPLLPAAVLGVIVLGTAELLGWRPGPRARTLMAGFCAVLVAVAIKDQLKYAFGRLWPETWVNNNPSFIGDGSYGFSPFHGGVGWSSFPSGHMTVIAAPMAVLAIARPSWRWIAAIPVALVAVGLYGADYHFVGDMIAGTLLGTICAAIVLGVAGRPLAVSATDQTKAVPDGPALATSRSAV